VYHLTDLDLELRAILSQLQFCSHAHAAPISPGGRTSDEPLGGRRPGNDLGAEEYARRYGPPFHYCTRGCDHKFRPARTDEQRRQVIRDAAAELEHLRGYGLAAVERPLESAEQLAARIVKDGEDWTVKEAAREFRCLERTVIAARKNAGRETTLGREVPKERLAPDERRRAVHALAAQGLTHRQIANRLGEHSMTIGRDLARSA
jgi:hypothetical protein